MYNGLNAPSSLSQPQLKGIIPLSWMLRRLGPHTLLGSNFPLTATLSKQIRLAFPSEGCRKESLFPSTHFCFNNTCCLSQVLIFPTTIIFIMSGKVDATLDDFCAQILLPGVNLGGVDEDATPYPSAEAVCPAPRDGLAPPGNLIRTKTEPGMANPPVWKLALQKDFFLKSW